MAVSSTILKVFGMTWPGIKPRSPGPLANTQTIMPISGTITHTNTNQKKNNKQTDVYFIDNVIDYTERSFTRSEIIFILVKIAH